jgi:hypothetical protein
MRATFTGTIECRTRTTAGSAFKSNCPRQRHRAPAPMLHIMDMQVSYLRHGSTCTAKRELATTVRTSVDSHFCTVFFICVFYYFDKASSLVFYFLFFFYINLFSCIFKFWFQTSVVGAVASGFSPQSRLQAEMHCRFAVALNSLTRLVMLV